MFDVQVEKKPSFEDFTEAEQKRMREATKTLLRDTFIPRENPGNESCKDVYNVLANPRFRSVIETNLSYIGFALHVSTELGLETAWVTDLDKDDAPKNVLRKVDTMVYILMIKKFLEDRNQENNKQTCVIPAQYLFENMANLNRPITKAELREILFDAQSKNLVFIASSKMAFDGDTRVTVLPSCCFYFDQETLSACNEYLEACAEERKKGSGASGAGSEEGKEEE